MQEHSDYFYRNNYIKHAYVFTLKLVKYFFPLINSLNTSPKLFILKKRTAGTSFPETLSTWPGMTRKSASNGLISSANAMAHPACAEGYQLDDGTPLNLSDKDQKWLGLKDTFKF